MREPNPVVMESGPNGLVRGLREVRTEKDMVTEYQKDFGYNTLRNEGSC